MNNVLVYDPTATDTKSKVRGVGRYMQILRENFPDWHYSSDQPTTNNASTAFSVKQQLTTFINPFFNFLSPPLFIKRKFPKQIAVIHDLIPLKYPEHFPIGLKGNISVLLNKIALLNYDVVITDSVQSKNDIAAILHIPRKKIKVIYPCLPTIFDRNSHPEFISGSENKIPKPVRDDNVFSKPNSLPHNYLLYVGDVTWNKNIVNLAKAIKMQELPCVFVGKVFGKVDGLTDSRINGLKNIIVDGESLRDPDSAERNEHWREKNFRRDPQNNPWQRELNEFISLVKNDKRFVFPGYISDEELKYLYQNALCNILVSRDEGFGFSYLEASSQRCPSILSDIPVLREISNNNALFVNPKDPKSIVSAIQSLQNDDALRNNLIKESHKRSIFFSQQSFKDRFLSILP